MDGKIDRTSDTRPYKKKVKNGKEGFPYVAVCVKTKRNYFQFHVRVSNFKHTVPLCHLLLIALIALFFL